MIHSYNGLSNYFDICCVENTINGLLIPTRFCFIFSSRVKHEIKVIRRKDPYLREEILFCNIMRFYLVILWDFICRYLHEGCQPQIVHQSFEPSNVLLDRKMSVRVAECGLASLMSVISAAQVHIFRIFFFYFLPELIFQTESLNKCMALFFLNMTVVGEDAVVVLRSPRNQWIGILFYR